MEFKFQGTNQQAPSHIARPLNLNYLAGQNRPDLRRSPVDFFRDRHLPNHQYQHQHQHQHHHHYPHPQPHPLLYPHPHGVREAIQREIEKKRIREEIIMSEIARIRVLEAEVRRELVMERELALRNHREGFPFGLSRQTEFELPKRRLPLGTRSEGTSREERTAVSVKETNRLTGRLESRGFDILPFQRGTTKLRISEDRPVPEGEKEKQKMLFLAKPDENVSGSKRKAGPLPGVDDSELQSDIISKKKAKEEWSCALCQVSATSEQGLNEHLQGKKHKSKEAELMSQRAGKNYSIGLFPKKSTKSLQVVGTVDPSTEGVTFMAESSFFKKAGEEGSKTQDMPPLQENPNSPSSDNLKKDHSSPVQNAQKNRDSKNKGYRFWCDLCNVGTLTLKVMNAHKKGKKHIRRLEKIDEKCRGGSSHPEKIAGVLNHEECAAEDGKNSSENIDETRDKPRSEKMYRFWCDLCNVGTLSQKVMNAHKKGRKHIRRLAESEKKCGDGLSHPEKIVVVLNHGECVAEDGKNTSENIDKTHDEPRSENDEKLANAVNPEDLELVGEANEKFCGAADTEEPDDKLMDVVNPEDHELVDETKEVLCGTGAMDITELEDA